MVVEVLIIVVLSWVAGFISGYGVRATVSLRRRTRARALRVAGAS